MNMKTNVNRAVAVAALAGVGLVGSIATAGPAIATAPDADPAAAPAGSTTVPALESIVSLASLVAAQAPEGADLSSRVGAPPKSREARRTYMIECLPGHKTQRARKFMLGCADGNGYLDKLTWSRWGTARAKAVGILTVNDCTPTCVAGTFRSYPVRVNATKRVSIGNGKRAYTQLTITLTGKKPADFPARFTERLVR